MPERRTPASGAREPAATEAARRRPRENALRTCVVTRTEASPERLLRFALSPEGVVTPDLRARLPGRGVWTLAERDIVAQAVKKGLFSRAFKTKAAAPADLPALVGTLMARDCLQSLAMANKAGLLVAGFGKIESALAAGSLCALLHAREAGGDGKRKLAAAARGAAARGLAAPETVIEGFESADLDLALGRTNVIHAGLKAGPATLAFLARWEKLRLYSPLSPDQGLSEGAPGSTPAVSGLEDSGLAGGAATDPGPAFETPPPETGATESGRGG